MRTSVRWGGATAVVLLATGLLAGCSGSSASTATGEPIVVASINALSGAGTYPEASQAAQAVFDQVNANGGIDGRPITYNIYDDRSDPAAASQAAREAVDGGAVALVGSASILDCTVNHDYYEQQGIASIQGTGVDPFCFSTPNIAPVNTGPYLSTGLALTYGSETLGLRKICALLNTQGSSREAYDIGINAWSKSTGEQLSYVDDTLTYTITDYTPFVVQLKQQGCDGVFASMIEPGYLGFLKAAEAQGLDATFLFLTPGYTEQFAQAASYVGKGVYVLAEFAPFTDANSAANDAWSTLMDADGIAKTSFAQGGYLAAENFVSALKGITGDITRDSVTAALKGMTTSIDSPMTGKGWIFGPGDAHNPNQSGWPVVLKPGSSAWESAGDNWITVKEG